MHKKFYSLFFIFLGLFQVVALAQDSTGTKKTEMADAWRANGKIYVVIAVLVIILAGLILYVIRLDRKISRFEKDNKR